ncbi:intron Large complex component GCFC2 [Myripristis murdjan]|uniref:GC-rich sequence DNA-binding factor 2 n=1 Tax=Myripristis murdjan TaxID=586833 RepID=A0A667ZVQ3_9TELE|nr:GC-rich sequence DNA-binding factor 2 [Myripristis murdjan]
MFNKKPRRNFRQRRGESSEEEGGQKSDDGEGNTEASAVINKPTKAAQSRGISCSSKREATPPESDSSDGEAGVERSELTAGKTKSQNKDGEKKKANTILSFSDDKEAEGPEFKLRKSSDKAVVFQSKRRKDPPAKASQTAAPAGGGVSPSASPRQDFGSQASPHDPQHDDDDDDDESDSDKGGIRSPSSSSSSSPASRHSTPKPVIIPSAKEIQASRRQRREARAQKEFIPLGRDGQTSPGSTPSRSSREDDEDRDDDDEPDDHERRIEFAPRSKSIKERIAEKLGASDGSASDSSEREEQELWEETQIKKGVKRRPGGQSPSGSESSSHSSSSSSRINRRRQKKSSAGANIPETLPHVSVSMVKRRISGKLDSLKEVHRARQAELRRMEGDIESARTSLENLEESSSEKQLMFYRAMTLYVHNLVECLREKIVEINSLELELHTLLSDQMGALLNHRRLTVREKAAHLQQLSYSTNEPSADSSNGIQSQSEAGTGDEDEEDCSDVPEDTQPSADEEEQLQRKKAGILSRSQDVFSDVQEEFSEVKKILSRFEEWRAAHSESYHSAYISLCLPKLLNPIIRHQLLAWNPLKDSNGDFEALPWYTAVETFCHGQGHEELEHTDRQTLRNVIEKTLLSKMTAFVELVWDPLSRHQSACLSDVCHRLREDYSVFQGEQTKPVKAFVEAVVARLRSCVDEDVFIPLYPKKFLEDKSSPQCRFRDKQFWMAVKLLGNMGKWDLLLPESELKELMLDKLLNRYLMITLLNQTQTSNTLATCKKIADCLPASWFTGVSECLPQLQSFRKHLVQTAHSICKQQPPEDPNTRSAVVEVLQVLSRIRSFDSVMAVAEKYRYQDVIYSHQLLNQDGV